MGSVSPNTIWSSTYTNMITVKVMWIYTTPFGLSRQNPNFWSSSAQIFSPYIARLSSHTRFLRWRYSSGGQTEIGSSSWLRIASRHAVVMSNVKIRDCIPNANTNSSFRIKCTGVEATASSRSWTHLLKPLTHSRLLIPMQSICEPRWSPMLWKFDLLLVLTLVQHLLHRSLTSLEYRRL